MLKQGPPPENTRLKKSTIYIGIFAFLGVGLCATILLFQDSLMAIGEGIDNMGGLALVDAFQVFLLAIPISLVQTFVLKENISAIKVIPFVISSAIAGFVGGFIGGAAISLFKISPGFLAGILIGIVIGGIFGTISSLIQVSFMKDRTHSLSWVAYSLVSNVIVWASGWSIGWAISGLSGAAISSALMMVISGISLSVYLTNTSVEF